MAPTASRNRRRGLLAALVLMLALTAGAWQVLERVLEVDAYRPRVEEELSRLTGLPTKVGRLDLAWRPIPSLSALDVSIGEGELRLETARIDLVPQLRALLRRQLVISRIDLEALTLTLPDTGEGITAAWTELKRNLDEGLAAEDDAEPAGAGPIESFSVRRVVAGDAVLRLGAATLHPLALNFAARGIDTDTLQLDFEITAESLGAEGEAHFEFPLLESDAEGGGLRGNFDLRGLRPQRLVELPAELQAVWHARGTLASNASDSLTLNVEGGFEPESPEALGGAYQGTGEIGGPEGTQFQLSLSADGLSASGSGELGESESRFAIAELDASGATLRALLAAAGEAAGLSARDDAALQLRAVEVSMPAEGALTLRGGSLAAQGIEASWQGRRIGEALNLEAHVVDGAIRIDGLEGGAIALTGNLAPLEGWRRVELRMQGKVGVDDALLGPLAPEGLSETRGVVEIDELRAVFGGGEARPEDALKLRARLVGGALRYASEGFSDRFSAIDLAISNQGSALQLDGRGRSEKLGALDLGASIEPDSNLARGNLGFDAGAATRLVEDEGTRARVGPLLRAFGPGRLDFAIEWPEAENLRVRIERAGTPSLNAALSILAGDAGSGLGELDVAATLPGKALSGVLPQAERLGGKVALRLRRKPETGRFSLDADLAGLDLAMGRFFEKRPGEALQLRVAGPAADVWSAESIQVTAKDAKLALRATESGLAATDLDLDLAAWSFLLVDGAQATGRVRGAIDPKAGSTRLQLDEVALQLSPTLRLDSASGALEAAGEDWTIRALHLRGARSDATLDATLRGGRIEGSLRGANLDVDMLRSLVAELQAWLPASDPEAPPSVRAGQLDLNLERIAFGRGEARAAQATLRWVDGNLQARDIALETYEGKVQGTFDLNARKGAPSQLVLDLDIDGITGRFLDDLFSEESRGIRGKFSGKLRFDAPLHADAKAMWANANGKLSATGTQGSFGRLGVATQLTTVLRSTEALRLKLPTMKDEGLVFDAFETDVSLVDGKATIGKLTLDSTSYAATAGGYLDFRKDESRVPIEFDAVKGITGFLGKIPVAGDAFKLVAVRLTGSGSPFDLKIGVASVSDQLIGVTMVAPNAVIGGTRDVLNLFRRNGNGAKNGETASAEPAQGETAPGQAPAPTSEPAPPSVPVEEPEPAPPSVPVEEPVPAPPSIPVEEPVPAPPEVEIQADTEAVPAPAPAPQAGPAPPEARP